MTLTVSILLLLIPFICFLVLALINGEFRGSNFWFQLIVCAAILLTFGMIR